LLAKAISALSGDHAGAESNAPGTSKSVRRPVPSAWMVSIAPSESPWGDVVVVNPMRFMSGDQLG
jgi:hypothetical protein